MPMKPAVWMPVAASPAARAASLASYEPSLQNARYPPSVSFSAITEEFSQASFNEKFSVRSKRGAKRKPNDAMGTDTSTLGFQRYCRFLVCSPRSLSLVANTVADVVNHHNILLLLLLIHRVHLQILSLRFRPLLHREKKGAPLQRRRFPAPTVLSVLRRLQHPLHLGVLRPHDGQHQEDFGLHSDADDFRRIRREEEVSRHADNAGGLERCGTRHILTRARSQLRQRTTRTQTLPLLHPPHIPGLKPRHLLLPLSREHQVRAQ